MNRVFFVLISSAIKNVSILPFFHFSLTTSILLYIRLSANQMHTFKLEIHLRFGLNQPYLKSRAKTLVSRHNLLNGGEVTRVVAVVCETLGSDGCIFGIAMLRYLVTMVTLLHYKRTLLSIHCRSNMNIRPKLLRHCCK